MSSPRELRTLGIVLRRTNYGEADRILNIITPEGRISAIAKGVRKEKSKLAGGVEMFSLIDFNIHQGKGELGIVTGAKMIKYYGGILKSLDRTELAAMVLKKVAAAAEEEAEFFEITKQSLGGLDSGMRGELVEAWFLMRLAKASGEEMNLYRDEKGEKLKSGARYSWDVGEMAFMENAQGEYGEDEIKILRIMAANDLAVVGRVKMDEKMLMRVLGLARIVGKL